MRDRRLELREVTIQHAGRALFAPVSLVVAAGQVATIMGESGSGKSSLLGYLAGTLDPALVGEGDVLVDGESVRELPPEQRRLALLFQDDLLFPHLSVAENLAFGLSPTIKDRAERRDRVTAALSAAELTGFGDRDPATLSGGQRARVSLMRALLSEPRGLLLDEPFSRLDAALRQRMREFVFQHLIRDGIPGLLVTHDPADAEAARDITGGAIVELHATS